MKRFVAIFALLLAIVALLAAGTAAACPIAVSCGSHVSSLSNQSVVISGGACSATAYGHSAVSLLAVPQVVVVPAIHQRVVIQQRVFSRQLANVRQRVLVRQRGVRSRSLVIQRTIVR